MNVTSNSKQLEFINKVKELLGPQYSLVDELADLLQVSTDSAYRRIRGDTMLSIDEVIVLCNHFKISFDMFSNLSGDSVTFKYNPIFSQEINIVKYFNSLLGDLEAINKTNNKQAIWVAIDIPIFHHFKFPELAAFKFFYWLKSVSNVKSLEGKKFDPTLLSKELLETGKLILEEYNKFPSIEILSDGIADGILKQIEYCWQSGEFTSKEQALFICDQLNDEINHLKYQAELSCKFFDDTQKDLHENNFQVYYSEIELGNNTILVNIENSLSVYLSHHTYNSLTTQNVPFCNETKQWIDQLIRKSTLISGVSEKQRHQYFKKIFKKIEALRASIEND
jgi:hypothetical protein